MCAKNKKDKKCQTPFCRNRIANGASCSTCRSRKARQKDPVKYAYLTSKNNAKRRGKGFLLTLEEFKKFCVKTKYIAKKGRHATGLTIDRIDNDGPYSVDNIQPLENRANVIKMHLHYQWWDKTATVTRDRQVSQRGNPF